jgi:hypothetical protein
VSYVVSFKVGRLAESKFFYHEEAHSGDMSTAYVMLMNSSFLLIVASAPRTLPPTSPAPCTLLNWPQSSTKSVIQFHYSKGQYLQKTGVTSTNTVRISSRP